MSDLDAEARKQAMDLAKRLKISESMILLALRRTLKAEYVQQSALSLHEVVYLSEEAQSIWDEAVKVALFRFEQQSKAGVWDEGWDAGNFYAVDDFNRGPKTKNPYGSKP